MPLLEAHQQAMVDKLPDKIKGTGYIAVRQGDVYLMDYLTGGHIPEERSEVLTIDEMRQIYEDPSKWNEVMVCIEMRKKLQEDN